MKQIQYSVYFIWFAKVTVLSLTSLLIIVPANAQLADNKLLIIEKPQEYRRFIRSNKEMNLVYLKDYIKPFYSRVTYTTTNNFTGKVLYPYAAVYVTKEAALLLQKVQDSLLTHGKSILIYDGYRPYSVTVEMWLAVPDENYAANPANGSGHNRGIAIDLTLADANTGQPLEMPTQFDSFSDTAHHAFNNLPAEILKNRALLKGVMEHFGFLPLRTEWWHYSLPDPKRYPLLNLSFESLDKLHRQGKLKRK